MSRETVVIDGDEDVSRQKNNFDNRMVVMIMMMLLLRQIQHVHACDDVDGNSDE